MSQKGEGSSDKRRIDYPQTTGVNRTYKAAPKAKKVAEATPTLFDQK